MELVVTVDEFTANLMDGIKKLKTTIEETSIANIRKPLRLSWCLVYLSAQTTSIASKIARVAIIQRVKITLLFL